MRTSIIVVEVLLFCVSSFAQPKRVTLELGSVTVYLGMPRRDAIEKCADAKYKLIVSETDFLACQEGDETPYTMHFKNDRLIYATREWYKAKSGSSDPFQSTVAALSALADHWTTPPRCYVEHNSLHKPDQTRQTVMISCGNRSISLVQIKLGEQEGYSVTEDIGELAPSPLR